MNLWETEIWAPGSSVLGITSTVVIYTAKEILHM